MSLLHRRTPPPLPPRPDLLPSAHGRTCGQCGAPAEPFQRYCAACGATVGEITAGTPVQEPPSQHEPLPKLAPLSGVEGIQASSAPTPWSAEAAAGRPADPLPENARRIRCETCGAELSTDAPQRSITCPFCDSNYVVAIDTLERQRHPVEFVLGFTVTPEQAQAAYQRWIAQNNWFRPGDLASVRIDDRLRGVYLPFWTFSMRAESRWNARIGEHWYRTETYTTVENGKTVTHTRTVTETEWWPLSGGYHRYHWGYLVSGSRGLPQGEAEGVMPFHLEGLKRYEPYFLAGWLSEEYSLASEEALARCQEVFSQRQAQEIAGFMPGDTHSGVQVATNFLDVNADLVLLPVYILSYRYQDRVYRFLMNGQTAKVAGDKPVSTVRIVSAVIVGVSLAVALGLLVWLLSRVL